MTIKTAFTCFKEMQQETVEILLDSYFQGKSVQHIQKTPQRRSYNIAYFKIFGFLSLYYVLYLKKKNLLWANSSFPYVTQKSPRIPCSPISLWFFVSNIIQLSKVIKNKVSLYWNLFKDFKRYPVYNLQPHFKKFPFPQFSPLCLSYILQFPEPSPYSSTPQNNNHLKKKILYCL